MKHNDQTAPRSQLSAPRSKNLLVLQRISTSQPLSCCQSSGGCTDCGASAATVPAGTIYTCPMHPEVRQTGPGHCPKCGMALEPLMPTATGDDSEIRSVRRRFWIALTLALPVMVVAMAPHLLGMALDPDAGPDTAAVRTGVERARGVVGRVTVLPPRLARHHSPCAQYVHVDWPRRDRGVYVQL